MRGYVRIQPFPDRVRFGVILTPAGRRRYSAKMSTGPEREHPEREDPEREDAETEAFDALRGSSVTEPDVEVLAALHQGLQGVPAGSPTEWYDVPQQRTRAATSRFHMRRHRRR